MNKLLFSLCIVGAFNAWSQNFDPNWTVAPAASSDQSPSPLSRVMPLEPEAYRALTGRTSNCGTYQRVYADGSCETDRWTRGSDGSNSFVWNGGSEFEMRCQREQFDRDADIANDSIFHREVVVRFRENAQRNRDDARRTYMEIEEDGVVRRVEVGSTRDFKYEQCRISRGPQPQRSSGESCDGEDSVTSCLIRRAEVTPVQRQGAYGLEVNIQF